MERRLLAHGLIVLAVSAAQASPPAQSFDPRRGSLPRDEPQPIYAADAGDPWNRVFSLLFTRTVEARLPADVAAPFASMDDRLPLSDRTVTRIESGDRAIDPFYPSLLWMGAASFDESSAGPWQTLKEPRYSRLESALTDVASSAAAHPPLARGLMQADLWAAFDILSAARSFESRSQPAADAAVLKARRDHLLTMLARAVRSLALTRDQIAALPDIYAAAARRFPLPALFDARSAR